jgi:hypothetical protein
MVDVSIKKEFKPNPLLLKCIELVTDELAAKVKVGFNAEFKVSMSTAACREAGKHKDGKFGFLRSLVARDLVKIPPLRLGEGGKIGNWLFQEARWQLKNNREEVLSANVAAIRENGKARVVTSGSFWKDTLLQPFSHITINLVKSLDNLRDGLRASRLGWNFVKKIIHDKGDTSQTNWIFQKGKRYIFSTDWENATNAPSPDQGWALTGTLLRKTGLEPDLLEEVKDYWLSPKKLYRNGKPAGYLRNGIPMGDPLTKTNLSLAHPVCDLYARIKTHALAIEEGNGDDVIAIIDDCTYADAFSEAAKLLGYLESEDDTFVTEDWGTYCEEWFHIPTSPINTCRWGSRFKNQLLLPYLDVPKIRIMLATERDRPIFSSDPTGKVTLMGHDEEYFQSYSQGPARAIFAIASAFQDISLATIDHPKPLFLPRQVFGLGKPPPDWSVRSWMSIFKKCRPWHAKLYINVMKEINEGKSALSGKRGGTIHQRHFEKESMLEFYEIPEDDPIKTGILVRKDEWNQYPEGVLVKLISLGYLIPESKIMKYYLFQERLEQLEQLTNRDLFECVSAEIHDYPDHDIESQETEDIVKRFSEDYKDQPYRLKIGMTENLYPDNITKLLDEGNPLRVTEVRYPLIDKFKGVNRLEPRNLYELQGLKLYAWFRHAQKLLRQTGEIDELPPKDIIEDDPLIVQEVLDGGSDIFIIVTDDLKLLRLVMNKNPDTWVFRISCVHYLQTNTWCQQNELDYDEEMQRTFRSEYKSHRVTVATLVDSGSVEAWMNKYQPDLDETGTYWQTVGIPWKKNISARNMERKPLHGFISEPKARSFRDLRFPRSIYDRETHRLLKQSIRPGT